jgi:prefoldin subunit 5
MAATQEDYSRREDELNKKIQELQNEIKELTAQNNNQQLYRTTGILK